MLVGQGEELPDGPGADLPQGRDQPGHHAAEQLVGLQVQRRLRQPRVAPVQLGRAEELQPADRPVQEFPDDGLGGRVPGERVQEPLHGGGRGFFTHRKAMA